MGPMAQLHTSMPGTGGTSSMYGGPTPQKKRNGMAIASISLAALSITLPFFSCVSSSFLGIYFGIDHFSIAFFIPLLVTLIPAVLAVIFGHIGKRRATTMPGLLSTKDTAATGMVIGYIFGSIYLAFCLSYFLIAR
jgi:hypothetical protein